MLGYDLASTYHNRRELKLTRETVSDLAEAIVIDFGSQVNGAPLQVDGRLYAGGERIACIDLETGAEIWENPDIGSVATLAYADGTLYVHDFGSNLRALDAATGAELWQLARLDESEFGFSSPIVVGERLYVGASSNQEILTTAPTFRGHVDAANRSTGRRVWSAFTVPTGATGAAVWSSVSADVPAGLIFVGTGNNYTEPATDTSDAILALKVIDGSLEWKNQRYAGDVWSLYAAALGNPEYDFGANPVVLDAPGAGGASRLVAAGQKSGDVHVLDRDTGELVCTRSLSPGSASGRQGIFNNGAWDGFRFLVAANGATSDAPGSEPSDSAFGTSVLFALDPLTCDIVWERQLPGPVMAPITVAGGVGFVGADRHLEAFDTETGERLFDYEASATIGSAATISDGRVAFGVGLSWTLGTSGTSLVVLSL
jgi:polyvinyl alcohol dehydrogenase (cytochrome)